jgi:1-acyl-sn-glycerol-3-phosphate acyltransferase
MLRRLIGTFFFRYVLGWRMENTFPAIGSCVVIIAPHTSNADLGIGLMAFWHHGNHPTILIKQEAFKGPAGWLLRALKAIPVDRSKSSQALRQQIARQMQEQTLYIAITPEGTRNKAERWRTGFYHIAVEASKPIIPAYMDYSRKRAGYGPVLYPSGDRERDFAALRDFYANINAKGKYPALSSLNLQA